MNFSKAMQMASPALLGMASDMEGRTANALGLGLAKMGQDKERADRKDAVAKLMGQMGLAPEKRGLLDSLPVEMQQQFLLNRMEREETMRRQQAAAGASAARKAQEQAAIMQQWQGLTGGGQPMPGGQPVPSNGADGQVGPTIQAAQPAQAPDPHTMYKTALERAYMAPPGSIDPSIIKGLESRVEFFAPEDQETTQRQRQIAQYQSELGLSKPDAIAMADGFIVTSRDPITGEVALVDKRTMFSQPAQAAEVQPEMPVEAPAPALDFGEQYPNADGSFGFGGALAGFGNKVTDAIGLDPIAPDVQQSQADFNVLSEKLVNDMASAYQRQPPSWLLKNIAALSPRAGNVFEGSNEAQTKLRAIGRDLQDELSKAEKSLKRRLRPGERTTIEERISGLRSGLNRVSTALNAFGGGIEIRPEVADRLKAYQ